MSVRERLSSFSKIDSMIECKRKQYDRASAGLTGDFCTAKARELAEEIKADTERLEVERRAIMQMIDGTPNLTPDELAVLYQHYLEGNSYEALAKEMHYATTSVYRICMKGLDKVVDRWETT